MSIKNHTIQAENIYWVAHNGSDIFNYDKTSPGNIVTTCQPYFETFKTCEELTQRLLSFGVTIPCDVYQPEV